MDHEKGIDVVSAPNVQSTPEHRRSRTARRPLRRLFPGDWVEVRSEGEILATLDEDGTLDNLPFMPEMWRFIGRRFQVKARADRTCVENQGIRSMVDTVHLGGVYCMGEAHDGCCRGCLVFWKEAWLKRVTGPHAASSPTQRPPSRQWKIKESEGHGYFCQATRLRLATTRTLPIYHLHRHVNALWSEAISPLELARSFMIRAQDIVRQRFLGGGSWSRVPGTCSGRTPSASLSLKPGERVRVKHAPEILATLDRAGRNRGLEFCREMLRFCGQDFTVLRRCDRIIRDDPPVMIEIKDTVILEGLTYLALSSLAIPRGEFFFWRECWLERVGERG